MPWDPKTNRILVSKSLNCVAVLEHSSRDLTTDKLLAKNSEKNLLVSSAYFPYDDIESPREVQDLIVFADKRVLDWC